jgi:DNA-binding NarL/FixJ family response regulator
MSPPSRVLVADDDAMVREAYRAFFGRQDEFELVGEARNGSEAVELYAELEPAIVLMDLQMPVTSGIDATREICGRWPGACVVVLTTFGVQEFVVAALRAGASGYLLKDAGQAAILEGIRQALAGDMPLSSGVRKELVSTLLTSSRDPSKVKDPGLTPREMELLQWLAHGLTNQKIGRKMYLSEGSVKQYLSHIGAKLGVNSRTQILIKSVQFNLVDPNKLSAYSS